MKTLKIGICGWGNVATGLFKAIEKNSNLIQLNGGVNLTIDVIGARRDNPKCNPGKTKIERDIFDVLKHDIDVVVELIGGVEVARELIIKAIHNKKHVVTANKAVIFHHGDELFKLAQENGVKILFESAVCAGTPIIKLLKEELAANKVSKISGMLNGTSNFILSNMEEGADFDSTLKLAQDKGYAEPDPAFDIEGMDAAHKIGILSSLAFGTSLPPEDFFIEGITKIQKSDFSYAMDMGYTIKHLAVAKINESSLELRAHPALISLDSHLANLKGVRNGMEIDTDLIGKIHIAGSGAGQESTASGLISDLIHLSNTNEISDRFYKGEDKYPVLEFSNLVFQYYFYIEAEDKPGVMASITSLMASKEVGIESIVQKEELGDSCVPIILITDPFKESDHAELQIELLNLDSVRAIRSIRIEAK
ncbi:MAG: homoserine dehydrogenase [Proteobacteria bacterium]|uniref:Homoserine dehydrogenase n=1 Tax=SAR86 cluster bacterium TaxID=2030880 RepID=A0A937IFF5_9GAMM|nr:homoserine dehydrogenase [SAR86 cluster bacterium]MDA0774941.1 homoserine dehydrogenase [Pseudomonadota bacterium]MDA0975805.1 homoserine dehydrogenase [Pseudomonadota bacterium]MDA1037031.1 homoserine dehydrogenase [Pseudomonadota bacterium]